MRRELCLPVLFATAAAVAPPPAVAAPPSRVLAATQVRALVRKGPVALQGITIRGTLDLRPLGTVEHRLECRSCRLDGDLVGSGVVFDRAVDLSDSQIAGAVRMQGAHFREPLLLGSTVFEGKVDFSLVKFDDFVSFEEARFSQDADFVYARFGSEAIFTTGTFQAGATFKRAWFMSAADFRQCLFRGDASLAGSEFHGPADFSDARFLRYADLRLVRFDGDAAFAGTEFAGASSELAASFERVTAEGSLNFAFSKFLKVAQLSRMTARQVLLADARFTQGRSIVMKNFAATDLRMSVGTVLRSVRPNQRRAILRLIETSAKTRGDLGVANDAHYAEEVLASHGYPWPRRSLDFTFYRLIAGYFVRPLRPLTAFLVLVVLFSLARCVRTHQEPEPEVETRSREKAFRLRRRLRVVVHGLSAFGVQCLDTISFVGRLKSRPDVAVGVSTRIELLAYRALVVCVLIGLANSNPTLRQMFDAVV